MWGWSVYGQENLLIHIQLGVRDYGCANSTIQSPKRSPQGPCICENSTRSEHKTQIPDRRRNSRASIRHAAVTTDRDYYVADVTTVPVGNRCPHPTNVISILARVSSTDVKVRHLARVAAWVTMCSLHFAEKEVDMACPTVLEQAGTDPGCAQHHDRRHYTHGSFCKNNTKSSSLLRRELAGLAEMQAFTMGPSYSRLWHWFYACIQCQKQCLARLHSLQDSLPVGFACIMQNESHKADEWRPNTKALSRLRLPAVHRRSCGRPQLHGAS